MCTLTRLFQENWKAYHSGGMWMSEITAFEAGRKQVMNENKCWTETWHLPVHWDYNKVMLSLLLYYCSNIIKYFVRPDAQSTKKHFLFSTHASAKTILEKEYVFKVVDLTHWLFANNWKLFVILVMAACWNSCFLPAISWLKTICMVHHFSLWCQYLFNYTWE